MAISKYRKGRPLFKGNYLDDLTGTPYPIDELVRDHRERRRWHRDLDELDRDKLLEAHVTRTERDPVEP
jgi:hypothetical protein